jgi:hypothetical protein
MLVKEARNYAGISLRARCNYLKRMFVVLPGFNYHAGYRL